MGNFMATQNTGDFFVMLTTQSGGYTPLMLCTDIESQSEESILQVIEEKNAFIEKLKKLEEGIQIQLRLLSPKDTESLAQEAEVLKESLEMLLQKIIRMEEECEGGISLKMKEVEKKILGLQKGKKIGVGYGRYPKLMSLISKKI